MQSSKAASLLFPTAVLVVLGLVEMGVELSGVGVVSAADVAFVDAAGSGLLAGETARLGGRDDRRARASRVRTRHLAGRQQRRTARAAGRGTALGGQCQL